jgi:hypothetical protein
MISVQTYSIIPSFTLFLGVFALIPILKMVANEDSAKAVNRGTPTQHKQAAYCKIGLRVSPVSAELPVGNTQVGFSSGDGLLSKRDREQ